MWSIRLVRIDQRFDEHISDMQIVDSECAKIAVISSSFDVCDAMHLEKPFELIFVDFPRLNSLFV